MEFSKKGRTVGTKFKSEQRELLLAPQECPQQVSGPSRGTQGRVKENGSRKKRDEGPIPETRHDWVTYLLASVPPLIKGISPLPIKVSDMLKDLKV